MHIIAHRGASAYEPENTIAAFERAIAMGADWVELDVRLTADGQPFVSHPDDLSENTSATGLISTSTAVELRGLDAGRGQRLPSFAEVVDYIHPRCGLYVELKAGGTPQAVLGVLRAASVRERVVLGSFDGTLVREVSDSGTDLPTALLVGKTDVDLIAEGRRVGAHFLHLCWESAVPEPHALVSAQMLASLSSQGFEVVIWHEERESELRHLVQLPVWGVCTNTPDLLKRIIG